MRVALVTDGIWPYVLGGMQKHSYYLCKYLAQQKIDVDLFHFNQSQYNIAGLEFFTEEEKKYIHSQLVEFPKSIPFPGHYLYNSYRYSKRIFSLLKPHLSSYDFIYTKGFTGWYFIHQKNKGTLNGPPVGVKFHGYEMFQTPPDFKAKLQHLFLLRWPVRSISQKADRVFSYGGKITEIIRNIGVKPTNIIELPSGVEASIVSGQIRPSALPIKFLFLGRYERRKGVQELNVAINQLAKSPSQNNSEFHFIGPIPLEHRIKGDKIFYHGEIRDKQKLNALITMCDVLVCPSWSEGMPNVILEGMANGLAVMATDVGATNVLVNEETGWLLSSSDPIEIEKKIHQILNTPLEQIDEKKKKALALIKEKFTWEKLVLQLISKISK